MNPPSPGVYTIRMIYQFGSQETIWKYASWDGLKWHLPPFYSFKEWIS
jgi:hypothetical protein